MSDMILTKTRMQAGIWEGALTGAGSNTPVIRVTHLGEGIDGVEVVAEPRPGTWSVRVPIPAERIADGVQTFLITDGGTGATLERFTIVAGDPLADDLRAEIDLLRAELDMLKRAFRRHCVETL
jgi:hypothetical protein